MTSTLSDSTTLDLTAMIASAYVANNALAADALPDFIRSVYAALTGTAEAPSLDRREPFVPVGKSVFPNYIICLEDGKKLLMLRRHLRTAYGLTPDEYRRRWGLPDNYPMTAPNYAAKRSAMAKNHKLGRRPDAESGEGQSLPPIQRIPEGVRGRRTATVAEDA
jgi:predicted transcriptional regulator